MSEQFEISAVICTYNRANYLKKALNSLINQSLDKNKYEIIVVDNASTDQTVEIVRELSNFHPNIKYIHEDTPGLSRARNNALENAVGKYIAYLDDDAVAAHNWLEKILSLFEDNFPKIICIGGKVTPIWETPRPAWLKDELLSFLSMTDLSSTQRPITDKEFIVGANISFVRNELMKIGGFSELIGRKKNNLLSGEETEVVRKLQDRHKCSVIYSPEILVQHHAPHSRLSKKWFILRYYWNGISLSLMEKSSKSQISYIKLLIKTILDSMFVIPAYFVNSEKNFIKICYLSSNIGRLLTPAYNYYANREF